LLSTSIRSIKGRKKVSAENQVIVSNSHPAIISRADFEAVQAQMKIRKRT